MVAVASGCVRTRRRRGGRAARTRRRPTESRSADDAIRQQRRPGRAAPGVVATIAGADPAGHRRVLASRSSPRVGWPSHRCRTRRRPRSPWPFPTAGRCRPGSGDVGVRMEGPDGMSATVTIAQTQLDPAEAFTEVRRRGDGGVRGQQRQRAARPAVRLQRTEADGRVVGHSAERSVEFLDRIVHIWTNSNNYLVAVHVQAPDGHRGFDAAAAVLIEDFEVGIP